MKPLPGANAYENSIVSFGQDHVELFDKDNAAFVKMLLVTWVRVEMLVMVYNLYAGKKSIPEIETLPKEEKEKYWMAAYELGEGKLTEKQRVQLCKVLYLFKN